MTLACSTANSTIYYTTNGSDPTNESTEYTGAIHLTTTTTIKAIAYVGNEYSSIATATYTILTPLTSLQQAYENATAVTAQVAITFDDWVITGHNGSNNNPNYASNAYLTDGTEYGCLIDGTNLGFNCGDKLSGTAVCNIQAYTANNHTLLKVTNLTSATSGLTINTGGTVTPIVKSISELTGKNVGSVFSIKNLTYINTNTYFQDDDDNKILYLKLNYDASSILTNNTKYDITGVYISPAYSTISRQRISPRSSEDIVLCPVVTASPSSLSVPSYVKNTPASGIGSQTLTVNGTNLRCDITVALEDGSSSDFEISETPENSESWGYSITIDKASGTVTNKEIAVRLKAGRDVNSYSDKIIINSTDATTVEVNVRGSVTYVTLTYNGNTNDGGSAPAAVENCTYDQAITLAGNTNGLTKTGYTFDGWNTKADGTGTGYPAGATFNITENTTLYAKWTLINYNITKSEMTNGDVTVKIGDDVVTTATIDQTVTLVVVPAANYELDNLTVTRDDNGEEVTVSNNSFTMPASAVTVSATFVYMYFDGTFLKVSADLANLQDGGYYILYNTKAMNSTLSSGQMGSTDVIIEDDIITNPNRAIVWKLVKNGDNWDLYSEREKKYCYISGASTSSFKMGATSDQSYNSYNVSLSEDGFRFKSTDGNNRCITYNSNLFKSYSQNSTNPIPFVYLYKYTVLIDRTITFNGNGGTYNDATTYTQSVYDGIQTNLDANQFTRANYVFAGWATSENGAVVYADGAAITVTDADLTLYAKWNRLYTATVDGDIIGGTVKIDDGGEGLNSTSVIAETTINLTVIATQGYAFKAWNVYKEGETNTKVTVTNNHFEMPAYNVIISAEFHDKYTITFSVNGNTTVVAPIEVTIGQSTNLSGITATMEGFIFAGWSLTESGAVISNTYTPTANVTLYAVFTINTSVNMVINSSTQYFPTSYGSANTFTEYTLNGKKFKIQQGYVNGSKLQWRSSKDSSGAGTMYNSEDFGQITSVVLVYDASDNNKNFTINAGTTENPTSGTSITPSISGNTYTFDLSGGNYTYFVMTNGQYAGYLTSITICYSGTTTVTFTNITENTNRSTNIPANEVVTVKNGAALTFTGSNNGTANNLVIEDGGQLIVNNTGVKATVKKHIDGYGRGAKGTSDWCFIASPVSGSIDPTSVDNMIPLSGNYDLYRFNEAADLGWENYKAHTAGFQLVNGLGYLYANANGVDLSYEGSVTPSDSPFSVDLDFTSAEKGWNLVGNPFTCNATVSRPCYVISDNSVIATEARTIAPGKGVMVKAADDDRTVTFTKTTDPAAMSNGHNAIEMTLAQNVTTRGESSSQTLDNAIVSFNEGSLLGKFYFGNQDANIYIPQDNEEYAIVSSSAQGEMPVNFRAYVTGEYTITVNPQEVEMGYLHLIDNIAGVEVDLLANPSYTFNARYDDYESRFRLVFSANMVNTDLNDDFAFFSNGQLVIANEGEAILQVIDVNGRIIATESINGTCSKAINAKAGVYVLRLINGTDVKTQKIIVK